VIHTDALARERTRQLLETAEQKRQARRARTLRRATRMEFRAERRMIEAWRRAAELRAAVEAAE
jgi:hypothetical protein